MVAAGGRAQRTYAHPAAATSLFAALTSLSAATTTRRWRHRQRRRGGAELELELIQTHIAQEPVLRVEVGEPSQELLPKYIEQDAKQGPSSQFAERAGSGLQACNKKEMRGLGVRAQVCV